MPMWNIISRTPYGFKFSETNERGKVISSDIVISSGEEHTTKMARFSDIMTPEPVGSFSGSLSMKPQDTLRQVIAPTMTDTEKEASIEDLLDNVLKNVQQAQGITKQVKDPIFSDIKARGRDAGKEVTTKEEVTEEVPPVDEVPFDRDAAIQDLKEKWLKDKDLGNFVDGYANILLDYKEINPRTGERYTGNIYSLVPALAWLDPSGIDITDTQAIFDLKPEDLDTFSPGPPEDPGLTGRKPKSEDLKKRYEAHRDSYLTLNWQARDAVRKILMEDTLGILGAGELSDTASDLQATVDSWWDKIFDDDHVVVKTWQKDLGLRTSSLTAEEEKTTEQKIKENAGPYGIDKDGNIIPSASISNVGWSPMWKNHIRNMKISDPMAYSWMLQQGLSSDPLQRTAHSQFLLQGTEDNPWGSRLSGGGVNEFPTGKKFDWSVDNDPNINPYQEFMNNYTPLIGTNLLDTIDDVIDVISKDTWKKHLVTGKYSDADLQHFRWRNSYLDSPNSDMNQQALAALPIIQETPGALRKETAAILGNMHDIWEVDPNRPAGVGWLEYVDQNNYFGLLPDNYRTRQQKADPPYTGHYRDFIK